MRWTVEEIADVVGGRVVAGDASIEIFHVTQDSRDVISGSLFVPLIADRDGHEFIRAAVAAGAAAVLSARPLADTRGLEAAVAIEVADTGEALSLLGGAGRDRLEGHADVVGITGSVGKTTTKDLLAAVLATDRSTHANHRSFNNEIGVPLTILSAPDGTKALVLEMGARGLGHIRELCVVGRPTVGIVTSVGLAHTSEFGSVEAVAEAKGELIDALPPSGCAVLNAAYPLVAAMATRSAGRVVRFGPGEEVAAEKVVVDDDLLPRFRLVSDWGSADVVLGVRGAHLVENALAAAAAALVLGLTPDQVAAGLAEPVISPMRMELTRTARGARVLNDAYNANPLSMEAALRSLAALPAGRRVAVLGEMAELGSVSVSEHVRMGELAAELGIEVVNVNASDYGGTPVGSHADAFNALGVLDERVAVLVKGSRVARLEELVALLLA